MLCYKAVLNDKPLQVLHSHFYFLLFWVHRLCWRISSFTFLLNVLWVSLPTNFSVVERKRRDTIKCFCFLLQFPQHYRSIKPLTWQQWVLYAKGLFQDICCVWLLFSDFWHFWPWQMNIMLSIHLFLAILQWACLSGSFFAGVYDLMSHETIKICKYR